MKRYNISQLAKELGIARQTLYYWIKKKWIKPKRDYRKYPVFTEKDVKNIKEWRDKLEEA
ncbi:MerR family transcriptional regulator [bacterium]|nr:MerR family transcriptional regulator [bacterium]